VPDWLFVIMSVSLFASSKVQGSVATPRVVTSLV
jgi:hypothetical protein